MRITNSTEYATRLMVSLARKEKGVTVSGERLAESENVPPDYVNQLLLRLRRAELVLSHRGSGGGYSLSRSPSEITLGQIVRAVEGRIFEDVCEKFDEGKKDCRNQKSCQISPVWKSLSLMVERYFDGITLARLIDETQAPESWSVEVAAQKS